MERPSSAQIDEAVSKSLKNKETPPKRKHERNIILASWAEQGAAEIFADLFKRPLNVREISCYKCLIVIHKLIREGHPRCIADANARRNFFASLIKYYANSMHEYGRLSSEYATYIVAKLNFHAAHKEIDGVISLDKWIETHRGADSAVLFDTVTHLLDLQQAMLDWAAKVLNDKELTDCRVSSLIPCIIESYSIYCLTVHILKMLAASGNNADVFTFLVERFRTQYNPLRKYYFTSSNIRFITSIIAVPVLAPEPPQFGAPKNVSKKPKSPRKEDVIEVEVPDFNPRGANAQQDVLSLFGQQPPAPVQAAPSPFFNEWLQAQSTPVPAPVPVPVPAPEPQVIIKYEIPEDILRRLAELEKRVKELEAYNTQLIAENNMLKAENAGLRNKLAENEKKLAAAEAARRLLLEEQLAQAGKAVKAWLSKFVDASELGNSGADCEGLLDAIERLRRLFGVLVSSVKDNSSHTPQAGRDVSEITVSVLADAKGIASLLEDLGLKNALMGASQNAANALAAFLVQVQEIVGSVPNGDQLGAINREDAKIRALLDALEKAVNATLASQKAAAATASQQRGSEFDLEDIAERELLAAAKMIEDAAAALEAQRAKRAPSSLNPGELNVEESIMAAAMAITAATQGLVKAAADAQHERVVKGKVSDPSMAKYHHDPMWIEGLISAARAVAEATRQLVGVANDAFMGRIDDAALIAASKAVGSSTAQLVAATRSKSDDIFSKTQTNLDNAAAAVTRATQALVRAAKNNQEQDFEAMALKRNENIAAGIKAEIEQQARILRLEKELEGARRVLHGMNKSKYEDANATVHQEQAAQRQRRGTITAAPGTMGGFVTDDSIAAGGSGGASSSNFGNASSSAIPVNASSASSAPSQPPGTAKNFDTFNTSVKDLQNKVGAQLTFGRPSASDGPASATSPRQNNAQSASNNNSSNNNGGFGSPAPAPAPAKVAPVGVNGNPPPPPPAPGASHATPAAPAAAAHPSPANDFDFAPASTSPAPVAPAAAPSPTVDSNNPFL